MSAKTAKTKYDNLLESRQTPAQAPPIQEPEQATTATPATPRAAAKPSNIRLAKSKDPNKNSYTLILDIATHTDANAILKKLRTGDDLSDLTQRLLADWVEKNKSKVA